MAGTDDATLLARGKSDGDLFRFEGALKELPGVAFSSVMTPIEEGGDPDRRRRWRRWPSSTASIPSTSVCCDGVMAA